MSLSGLQVLASLIGVFTTIITVAFKILDDRISRKILENNDVLMQRINSESYVRPKTLDDAVLLLEEKIDSAVDKRDMRCDIEKECLERIERQIESLSRQVRSAGAGAGAD